MPYSGDLFSSSLVANGVTVKPHGSPALSWASESIGNLDIVALTAMDLNRQRELKMDGNSVSLSFTLTWIENFLGNFLAKQTEKGKIRGV